MEPKTLLFLVGWDPRDNPRPAEAVRIAAGLGAWQSVRASLYFHGPSLACLGEFPEELEGGHLLAQYLPMITKHGGKIYVEASSQTIDGVSPNFEVVPLDPQTLADLKEKVDYCVDFGPAAPDRAPFHAGAALDALFPASGG